MSTSSSSKELLVGVRREWAQVEEEEENLLEAAAVLVGQRAPKWTVMLFDQIWHLCIHIID